MYIFYDKNKRESRYKSYLKSIETQYNKMLIDLTDNNYKTTGLPLKMNKYDKEPNFPGDLKSMLSTMENDNVKSNGKKYKLDYLYPIYRILSFYAHGNINKTILDELSPKINKFSVINIPEVINIIANHYNCLIGENWPKIIESKGYQLG